MTRARRRARPRARLALVRAARRARAGACTSSASCAPRTRGPSRGCGASSSDRATTSRCISRPRAGPRQVGQHQRRARRRTSGNADWLLIVDDDVILPRGFLDRFLVAAEAFGLDLAQPAHAFASHAAWDVTRRRRARSRAGPASSRSAR